MLWFDNDPKKPVAKKIQEGYDYCVKRYGKIPTKVMVHSHTIGSEVVEIQGLEVEIKPIQVNHFLYIM